MGWAAPKGCRPSTILAPRHRRGIGEDVKTRLYSFGHKVVLLGLVVVAASSFLSLGTEVHTAGAANNGQYSIFPATVSGGSSRQYFNYLVNPGSIVTDAVTVTNQTTQPISFKLYAADASNAQGGGFTINPPQSPLTTVGKWVQLSTLGFELPPHTLANVPFTLKIPAGETPGDYAGGIVLSPTTPAIEKSAGTQFRRISGRRRADIRPGSRSSPSGPLDLKTLDWHVWLCRSCRRPGQLDGHLHVD